MQTAKNIEQSFQTRHLPELDGIRGIAILSVLFYHLFWFTSPGAHWTGFPFLLWKVAQVGWAGVNLFFVLSGFLITRILIHQKGKPYYFSRFYKRRALRILPLYLVTLAFIFFHYENSGTFVLISLAFLAHIPSVFGVTPCYPGLWSLSVEEQFYLVWPQLIQRFSLNSVKRVSIFLCVVSAILRGLSFKFAAWSVILGVLGGYDGFAYGSLLAIVFWEEKGNSHKLKAFSLLCFVIALGALLLGYKFGIGTRQKLVGEMFLPSLIYLISASFMAFSLAHSGANYLKILSKGILPQWGKLSFAAYLCHYPVPEITNKILSLFPEIYSYYFAFWFSALQFVLSLGMTYIISLLLHHWVELPFLKWKETEIFSSKNDFPRKEQAVPSR